MSGFLFFRPFLHDRRIHPTAGHEKLIRYAVVPPLQNARERERGAALDMQIKAGWEGRKEGRKEGRREQERANRGNEARGGMGGSQPTGYSLCFSCLHINAIPRPNGAGRGGARASGRDHRTKPRDIYEDAILGWLHGKQSHGQ